MTWLDFDIENDTIEVEGNRLCPFDLRVQRRFPVQFLHESGYTEGSSCETFKCSLLVLIKKNLSDLESRREVNDSSTNKKSSVVCQIGTLDLHNQCPYLQ